jgi:hypothetical protein
VSFTAITLFVLLFKKCLLFILLSTQSGNFWIHTRISCDKSIHRILQNNVNKLMKFLLEVL